ncbi:MAG: TIGR00730 family Rossman fold protein [Pseudomonadota bacterium]
MENGQNRAKSICVYCGSKLGRNDNHRSAAETLGTRAAELGWRIVYGGGTLGLMGTTAKAAFNAGGKVFGVIPKFLVQQEGIFEDVDHRIVDTMHERKMLMFEEADAIVTLPGGIGTLEEVVETVSWARLQLHRKPIILVNIDGYWSPLKQLFDHVVGEGFADRALLDDIVLVDTVEDVFKIAEARTLSEVV